MTPPPLGPPYRIVTPNVVLRCFEPGDAPAVQRLLAESLEHLRPWIGGAEEPKPLADKLREVREWRAYFDLDRAWNWAVVGADDGELAGAIVLNRPTPNPATLDTGGWVGSSRARRGFQTDAASAVARVAFDVLGATRLQAATDPANERSNALMRKLGFTHEATTRHLVAGQRNDELVWSILLDEWPGTFAAQVASEARAFDALGNRMF
ncbi:MAG TPA: GNAT family protein [Longimicrobium sp.]|nr:GNAT family protein [Longimicrobium sp.]